MPSELAFHERHFARFYDWEYASRTLDLPCYLGLARRYGSPLLELAAGTGRISIPLARAGHEVVAMDLSAEMLRHLKRKLRQEPAAVRRRVHVVQGDMAEFACDRPVRVAFVPFNSFFHLHTDEPRLSCLKSAYRALAPGGAFLIDLRPARMMEQQPVTERAEEVKCDVNPETGLLTRQLYRRLSQNSRRRCATCEHTYIEELPDGRERRYTFVQDYSWVGTRQMLSLLRQAGFESVKLCGGYGLRPHTERSTRVVFLAEK